MKGLSKDAVNWLDIGDEAAGQRVDNFLLGLLKGVPKSHVYRIVRSGEVRVNSKRVEVSDRLAVGDRLRVPPVRFAEPSATPAVHIPVATFPILLEDEALLAIDKPAGVAVHGGSGISFGVIEQLRASRPELKFLELVHRLDRDTSGVLLLAKKRIALVAMHALLRENDVDKRYLALIRGKWPHQRREIRVALHKFTDSSGERRVRATTSNDPDGQDAITIFTRKKVWTGATLVEARLKTGRTHQIRVHLAHHGFPIAGDDKYGDFEWNRALAKEGLKRMFLHAARLAFVHPTTGDPVELEAPLPPELAKYVARLDAREDPLPVPAPGTARTTPAPLR